MSPQQNRLAQETSPYLQQHADNPVAWYPWGAEALATARAQDKPILLSVGYSACHWCHVMAHESFEDPGVAEVMNALFVNIKVDREERPDLDKIYQVAQMLLNQRSGGWPLTMFLTPGDQIPFFGGTYFPKEPFHGLPGFVDLLQRVAAFYREKRDAIGDQNESMVQALHSVYARRPEAATLDAEVLERSRHQLEQEFDPQYGGFAQAPKFPPTAQLERLLRRWAVTRLAGEADARARYMALFTLERMAQGGIYDHLGGGFCRYSVDQQWMIPHFEKMLYDNGPLLALCARAAAAGGGDLFKRSAEETAAWTLREMQSPEGGYYSSLDADSEGEEGKYYVWDRAEVKRLLAPEDYALFARRFGLDRAANFEGKWHLYGAVDVDKIAAEYDTGEPPIAAALERARQTLFEARAPRVRPSRDEKILTSWNALMIKGMAVAARHLDQPEYVDSAERALSFVEATLWREGRLLATYKDGKAHLPAYLDDYAFLMDAVLELLQVRWRSRDLRLACALADVLLAHFEDQETGGFYFTSDEHETLVQRPKSLADESTPSGNGVAAKALARLGYLVGEPRYLKATERTLEHAAGAIKEMPLAHATLLSALEENLHAPQVIILRGAGETLAAWHRMCLRDYAPRRLVFAIPDDAADLPPGLADKRPQGEVVAYVCEGTTCSAPITQRGALDAALTQTSAVTAS